jgi:RNase H-fold protein (predicted Holliday junction resolvase)
VDMVDESMTSATVHEELRDAGMKASMRRKVVDSEAAVLILERWALGQV